MSALALPKFEPGMKIPAFLKDVVATLKKGSHGQIGFVIGNVGDGHSLSGMGRKFEALQAYTEEACTWVPFPVFSVASIFTPFGFYAMNEKQESQIEAGLLVERLCRDAKITDAFLMPGWHGSHVATLQRMVVTSLMARFHTGRPKPADVTLPPATLRLAPRPTLGLMQSATA